MADEMNTDECDMPEGVSRDDTVHGQTYYTAADMATASNQGFRDGVASLSAAEPAITALQPVAWRLRNTAFRSEVYEYFKTKYLAECRQKQFNASVDDGGRHDLTPLYIHPTPALKEGAAIPPDMGNPISTQGAAIAAGAASGLDPEFGPMLEFANAGEIAFYDYAVRQHCAAVVEILDGQDAGAGECNEPWAAVRKRLLTLVSASHGQAPAQPAGPCAICGSDEPFTGTCGSGDPRALCKQPTPSPQAAQQAPDPGPPSATVEEAARHVGKWLNERPNRPLDLRDVAMLAAHAQQAPAGATASGLQEQHARDSRELRRLCESRDHARRERDECKAENAGLEASCATMGRLIDDLRKDGDRLEWVLRRCAGSWLRAYLGVASDTGDMDELRVLIDANRGAAPAAPSTPASFQGRVERHSDQSVLVVFPSCRLASEFERSLLPASPTIEGESNV